MTALAVPAATPVGAAGSLRFTGKIVGDLAGTSLLIVATGGQAVRAIPEANGQFAVDVPASILRSFVEDYAGASVQVAKFGFYVGPVSLGAPKVWRLKTKLPSVVRPRDGEDLEDWRFGHDEVDVHRPQVAAPKAQLQPRNLLEA